MENSTILRELSEFDISAPISVSISFEDDFDETPIKTKIKTNGFQKHQETTSSAFIPILEPKTEIEADRITPCILTEELANEFTAHGNVQPESLQNQQSTNDLSRKRKTVEVQTSKPKKNKTINDTADRSSCDEVISSQTFASHVKENNIQAVPTASENAGNAASFDSGFNQSERNLNCNGLQQTDIDKINAYVINGLSLVSGNMILIMQAYGAHKRTQMSKENFVKLRLLLFKSSYKTVLTILVPEENNNELISTFLKDTVHHARLKSDSYFIPMYQDYANLLYEMITWAKNQQNQSQKLFGKSDQIKPAANLSVQNSTTTEPQVNTNLAQCNFQISNSNAERDKVCIFSSGPPESAVTININPAGLNKYFQLNTQNNAGTNPPLRGPLENNGSTTQGKAALETLTRFVTNIKPTHKSVIQPTSSQYTPNLSSSYSIQNASDCSIPSQQMKDRTPALRMQLETAPPSQSQLIQPVEPQRPAPRTYGHSRNFALQTQQLKPPPPYSQPRHLQTQSCPQQIIPPQYNQMPGSTPTQFQQLQYLQGQLGQQYVQPQQLHSQLGQSHPPVPEYNQTRQPQIGLSQQGPQQQQHPQIAEQWPSFVELLSKESTLPVPYTSSDQIQSGLSGQWQSRNQQPQIQQPTSRTEWHQGLNAIHQAGQVPQQTQKGSPRSASTDSGFISPLNFNVSTDQMMPTMPREPESTMPMIVHVTSLSDKVSYLELGKCIVCKKSTKQKCMGCMGVYYCSYECQSVDWPAHAPNCTQQNTN